MTESFRRLLTLIVILIGLSVLLFMPIASIFGGPSHKTIEEIRSRAESGNPFAQVQYAKWYEEGAWNLRRNYVESYKWYYVAGMQGLGVGGDISRITSHMREGEIEKARQLANEWIQSHHWNMNVIPDSIQSSLMVDLPYHIPSGKMSPKEKTSSHSGK